MEYKVSLNISFQEEAEVIHLFQLAFSKRKEVYENPEPADLLSAVSTMTAGHPAKGRIGEGAAYFEATFEADDKWERRMTDIFTDIAPSLSNGSTLKIEMGETYDELRVRRNAAIWIH